MIRRSTANHFRTSAAPPRLNAVGRLGLVHLLMNPMLAYELASGTRPNVSKPPYPRAFNKHPFTHKRTTIPASMTCKSTRDETNAGGDQRVSKRCTLPSERQTGQASRYQQAVYIRSGSRNPRTDRSRPVP